MQPEISIVIPNYQGRQLLARSLPHLREALAGTAFATETILVDDGSTDGSADYVRAEHAGIRLIPLASNQGFSKAMNRGVSEARAPLVYCMNSDVFPRAGFLEPLAAHFRGDPAMFAVMSANISPAGEFLPPNQIAPEIKRGMIRVHGLDLGAAWRSGALARNGAFATLFPSGGSALIDRGKFLELGGYAEIFTPFYYEDTDLGWRAWRRGWKILFEPQSVVVHDHAQGTIQSTQKKKRVAAHRKRNRFLLLWRNYLERGSFCTRHLLPLPLFLAGRACALDGGALRGFASALREWRGVAKHRDLERAAEKLTTAEIFDLLAKARRDLLESVGEKK